MRPAGAGDATGAAILTTLARAAGAMPAMTIESVGYGAGDMELEAPNIIRVFLVARPSHRLTKKIISVTT